MKFKTLLIFLIFSIAQAVIAQNQQDVINFLENNYYPKKVSADYYIESGEIKLPYAVKYNLDIGVSHGITNTHYFVDAVNTGNENNNNSQSTLSTFLRSEAMYVFKCKLVDFAIYDDNNFIFSADLVGIDLMTGEYLFYKNVSLNGSTKDKKNKYDELIAKTVRENLTALLKATFGTYNKVVELIEVDKDKVKKVAVMDIAFRKNHSRKDAAAYIVEKEVEIDGKPFFIFEKIAELKNPAGKNVGNHRVYEVGDGKKELLIHFNEKTPIYVSHYYLGAEK